MVSYEYPQAFIRGQNERYYPVPSDKCRSLYERYLEKSKKLTGKVLFLGRLGDYKYYDMDKAVARAFELVL